MRTYEIDYYKFLDTQPKIIKHIENATITTSDTNNSTVR
jgi:hypothetical protein